MGQTQLPIERDCSLSPVNVPPGHVGPVTLPGTDRQVWWTGRVAIGLRFERRADPGPLSQSAVWVQRLLIGGGGQPKAPGLR